jgi:adenylate cyclase
VLFADVRGYTKLTAGLSPAEVPAFVNRFYETASSALLHNHGLLGQIEGDNVMSLFVPGLAGAGYKQNAVEGGRALLQALGPGTELSLEVGVGISTGEEFVGNVGGGGYKDFAAVGDVTNLAARLTAKAEAGEVLVDAETYEAVSERYPEAERRELELKGKEGLVVAYAVRA